MKYLKTFESTTSFRHWSEFLYDKVKFDRVSDIKELTYSFSDEFDMISDISFSFRKNGFDSPGISPQEYLDDDVNLYRTYFLNIHGFSPQDPNKLIEFKECEVDFIKRLRGEGFIFKYANRSSENLECYIKVGMYHPDDFIDKDLFLNNL